ncbi:MAG: helix-turn-helix domain-containing protein [Chloroflexi bacterium]|nr:helix-turn-helix domain-containing protein [Chloroflexota bacterium]
MESTDTPLPPEYHWLSEEAHPNPMYTIPELAHYLDYAQPTISRWVRHGHFPGAVALPNSSVRIPRSAIIAFLLAMPGLRQGGGVDVDVEGD